MLKLVSTYRFVLRAVPTVTGTVMVFAPSDTLRRIGRRRTLHKVAATIT